MSLQEAHEKRSEIIESIRKALTNALNDTSLSEPRLVAKMVREITREFNDTISNIFSYYGVRVATGGVFVHQQPQVTSDSFPESKPKSVELGDLLFIMTHKRKNGTISRNALLLQAKKIKGYNEKKTDNKNQHFLYAYWPEFKYIRSTPALNGKKREVTNPHLYNGAKYLLIDSNDFCIPIPLLDNCLRCFGLNTISIPRRPRVNYGIFTAHPTPLELSSCRCFTEELYDFLFGDAGRSFVYQPQGNNINWDQVITDLMDVTAERITSYLQYGGGGPRGEGEFLAGRISGMLGGNFKDNIKDYDSYHDEKEYKKEYEMDSERDFDGNDNKGGGGAISTIEFMFEEKGE